MAVIGGAPLPRLLGVRTLFFMKVSHGLGLVLLARFAFACSEGVPAEPESAPPRAPSAASASAEGSTQGHTANGNGTARTPDEATPQGPSAAPTASSPSASPPASPSQPPLALTEQGAIGQKLFQDHCAGCHGGSVGLSSFSTAADVFRYVSTNMPRNAPGSLTQSEYFSIVAFDLTTNGVDLQGKTLDAANAGSVTVH